MNADNVEESGRKCGPDKGYDSGRDERGFSGCSKLASLCSTEQPFLGLVVQEYAIQNSEDGICPIPVMPSQSASHHQSYISKDNILQNCNVQAPHRPKRVPVDQLVPVLDHALPIPEKPSSRRSTHSRCSGSCMTKPRFI